MSLFRGQAMEVNKNSGRSALSKCYVIAVKYILGNQGVLFHLLVPRYGKENPWEYSLLTLVLEVKIQCFADWSTS